MHSGRVSGQLSDGRVYMIPHPVTHGRKDLLRSERELSETIIFHPFLNSRVRAGLHTANATRFQEVKNLQLMIAQLRLEATAL